MNPARMANTMAALSIVWNQDSTLVTNFSDNSDLNFHQRRFHYQFQYQLIDNDARRDFRRCFRMRIIEKKTADNNMHFSSNNAQMRHEWWRVIV